MRHNPPQCYNNQKDKSETKRRNDRDMVELSKKHGAEANQRSTSLIPGGFSPKIASDAVHATSHWMSRSTLSLVSPETVCTHPAGHPFKTPVFDLLL